MEVKLFEVRDAGAFIPMMAVKVGAREEAERWMLRRCGYSLEDWDVMILLTGINGHPEKSTYNPYDWEGNRTRFFAHKHMIENWPKLKSGDVIDVQFITGETDTPKRSERFDR